MGGSIAVREDFAQDFNAVEPATTTSPAPRCSRPRQRRSYFAMAATADEITLPKHAPVGYLTKTRLIQRAQADDTEATRLVWEGNARLTYTAANRLRVRPQLVADLIQGAQLAIPRAIRRFDPDRLLEFSTYAYAVVWREMQREVCRIRFFVRLPPQLYLKYIAFRTELERALTPSAWFDLRERLIDKGEYDLLRKIHALAATEPLSRGLAVTTPHHGPTEPIAAAEALAALHASLDDLHPRERCVLEKRYGLCDQREHTLEEIGLLLGLTKERVRQIQMNAETNLRALLVAKGWDGPLPVPVATLALPDPEPKEPTAV